nr:MAG TPA_asm: hypothetical protein [Caudoviricetes sp.]DAO12444.1 MAG TPA: hypothetical protein [Caudoviricetes sp.]
MTDFIAEYIEAVEDEKERKKRMPKVKPAKKPHRRR